jgi:hypothetical protein
MRPAYSLANLHIFSPDGVRRGEMQAGTSTLPFFIQAKLEAKKSVPAWAVYMKMQTDMLRDVLAKEARAQRTGQSARLKI